MAPPRILLDGGLGTSLEQSYGCVFSAATTPLWSGRLLLAAPDTLRRCHAEFARVPVDLLTATYQFSAAGLVRTPGAGARQLPEFVDTAVGIAAARVALSLGPYGACTVPSCEYSGRYGAVDAVALRAWHAERLSLVARAPDVAARVAFLALETVPRVDEIAALRQALPPALVALPFWISCLFPGDAAALPDGSPPEAAVRAMLDPGGGAVLWGAGINCTRVGKLDALLRRYKVAVDDMVRGGLVGDWPALVLYPDGTNGEVYNSATGHWERPHGTGDAKGPPWEQQLARDVRATQARGRWRQIVVGRYCQAGADDIARLRRFLLES